MEIIELFDQNYSEKEKDIFTDALHRKNQVLMTHLNQDSSVIVTKVESLGTYCTVYMDFDQVYYKNFLVLADAIRLHDKIVDLYEKG